LTLTRTFTARAQGVAEVAFEHAHDRLGLRTLSVGLTCLRPGQLPPHAPAVTASRRLATGPADAGLDQRYRPLRSGVAVIGTGIVSCVGEHPFHPPATHRLIQNGNEVRGVRAHSPARAHGGDAVAAHIHGDYQLGCAFGLV